MAQPASFSITGSGAIDGGLQVGSLVFRDTLGDAGAAVTLLNSNGNLGVVGNVTVEGSYLYLGNGAPPAFLYADGFNMVSALPSSNGSFQIKDSTGKTVAALGASSSSFVMGGDLGVGTATPSSILHVASAAAVGGPVLQVQNGAFMSLQVGGSVFMSPYPAVGQSVTIQNYNGSGTARAVLSTTLPNSGEPNLILEQSGGNVGIGTATPQATLDVNGFARLKPYSGAAPIACGSATGGTIAINSGYQLCVCNGAAWVLMNSSTACTW